jgi:hypothetical protein
MFYENNITTDFSFEGGLSTTSPENETRHLINRLRLEFRTASQRQLDDAVADACKMAPSVNGEKALQLARQSLENLLTPALDRDSHAPGNSEPPFRVEVKADT